MGGQSLARNDTVATLNQRWLEADTARKIYRVAAGTRWSTVIASLDALGFSPAVMQSNNDFGVASTFSVNAHGWPVPFSGCGCTVRALCLFTLLGDPARAKLCRQSQRAGNRHPADPCVHPLHQHHSPSNRITFLTAISARERPSSPSHCRPRRGWLTR
jgi:hypothetical protein